jgi:hypothetical protein
MRLEKRGRAVALDSGGENNSTRQYRTALMLVRYLWQREAPRAEPEFSLAL